jgi:hypothetical protein
VFVFGDTRCPEVLACEVVEPFLGLVVPILFARKSKCIRFVLWPLCLSSAGVEYRSFAFDEVRERADSESLS